MATSSSTSIEPYLTKPIIPYLAQGMNDIVPDLQHASLLMLQPNELLDLEPLIEPLSTPDLAHLPVLLHLDLVRGLSRDDAALRYIASLKRFCGVITVQHHLVSAAHRLGLSCVVRLFLQDRRGVERGRTVIEKSRPDAVELLPAVAAPFVRETFDSLPFPRIAGGLVRDEDTLQTVLESGCRAISSTSHELWALNRKY